MEFKPVVFRIGKEEYGVDINVVRGIEKVMQVVPVPNANRIIKGIINLRGSIIPICSLRRKFGKEDIPYNEDTKFIIVKTETLSIGLEVDSVGDIQNVEENNIFPVPGILVSEDTEYYKNIVNVSGRLIVMLDVDKLLKEEEMKALQKTVESL